MDIYARITIPLKEYHRLQKAEEELKHYHQGTHFVPQSDKDDTEEKGAESLSGAGECSALGASLPLPLKTTAEELPFSSRPAVLVKDDPVSVTQLEPKDLAQKEEHFEPLTTSQTILETPVDVSDRIGRSHLWYFLGNP